MSPIVDIERGFNISGSIPFVQIPSGALRATLGSIQSAIGGITCTIGLCGETISPGTRHWIDFRKTGQEHMLHGNINTIRGATECIFGLLALGVVLEASGVGGTNPFETSGLGKTNPFVLATAAGFSLIPMAIQLLSNNGFNPRIQYELPDNPAPKNAAAALSPITSVILNTN